MKPEQKYDLPNNCKLQLLKTARIEKLDDDYILIAHPFPQFEGEMLLLQVDPNDQGEKDLIVYKDYSLRKRMPNFTVKARMSALQKKQQIEQDQVKTRLQCLEVDLETPLSTVDWNNLSLIISEL
mmetsp:Transcript_1986/g.3495  ORF Transcript_1986/g.3495 Transcript_1986/m.3495 type:complete len:125 (+) Transcript_1986:910-1284(+)